MIKVEIYTDGACRDNPGPGGWGVLLRYGKHEKELSGAERDTTNNRMELMAAIRGLEALTISSQVVITTDSTYVRKGIIEWLPKWLKNNWKTASKKPVKNRDLWERLHQVSQRHDIEWHWVKGHNGHLENERADTLATSAIDSLGI